MTRSHSDTVIDISTRLNSELANGSKRATVPAPAPGVYANTSMSLYHAWTGASNSRLTKLRRSPAHLRAYLENGDDDTPALIMGRAVHSAILEPDDFAKRYCRGPEDRRTKAGKDQYEALLATHEPGYILKRDDFEAAVNMRDSVYAHPLAKQLLSGEGEVELSCVWDSEISEGSIVRCKARLDRITPRLDGGAIVDVKTTKDASKRSFERSIYEFGYYRQAAFYLHAAQILGLPARHFVIVAVEKEPPFAVATYRIKDDDVITGRNELYDLLNTYATCEALGVWPAYPQILDDIGIPGYAAGQIDDDFRARHALDEVTHG